MTGSTINVLVGLAAGGTIGWTGAQALASGSVWFRQRFGFFGLGLTLLAILWLMLLGESGAWALLMGGVGLGTAIGSVLSMGLRLPQGSTDTTRTAPARGSSAPDWSEPHVYALGPFEMAVSAEAAEGVRFVADADRYTWAFAAIDEVALSLHATVVVVGDQSMLDAQVQAEWTDWLAVRGHTEDQTVEQTIDGHRVVAGEAQEVTGASPGHDADWVLFWATQVGPYLFLARALIGHLPEGAPPSEEASQRARRAAEGMASSAIRIAIATSRASR